jgi:hypothetical protein
MTCFSNISICLGRCFKPSCKTILFTVPIQLNMVQGCLEKIRLIGTCDSNMNNRE